MVRIRNWMRIAVTKLHFPMSLDFDCKHVDLTHAKSLALLMDSAYRGTIDYEGETLEQCLAEMHDTINGKYGPFIQEASFVLYHENKSVAAVLVTEWKGYPLVAHTMTDSRFQGKGLAKFLLGRSVSALSNTKWKELFLVVTEGNIAAEKLYLSVGFKKAGRAERGTPPPAST